MALMDWVNMLAEFEQAEIDQACTQYLKDQPRRRPTPGEIRNRILASRGWAQKFRTAALPAPEEAPKARVSAEDAERICQAAGFTPRHLDAVTRRPMAATRQELAEPPEQQKARWTCETDPARLAKARLDAGLIDE